MIDDWIFLCVLVGNDFLPTLQSLDVREDAIYRLITLYKKCVHKTGNYLTDSGTIALEGLEIIMQELGEVEDKIFADRHKNELRHNVEDMLRRINIAQTSMGSNVLPSHDNLGSEENPRTDKDEAEVLDEVRLQEVGFKERYYESKFNDQPDNASVLQSIANQYAEGLCWVLQYYYRDCASWQWFYPHHYAPFASDFTNIKKLSQTFSKGAPLKPFEQLMSVFPAASHQQLPPLFGKLMTDPKSQIVDFYPLDFKLDLNGKAFACEGVALLPFVEEQRLLNVIEPFQSELTPEENQRNQLGHNRLYTRFGSFAFQLLNKIYEVENDMEKEFLISIDGIRGSVLMAEENAPEGW